MELHCLFYRVCSCALKLRHHGNVLSGNGINDGRFTCIYITKESNLNSFGNRCFI